MCEIDSNKKSYKRHFSLRSQRAISAALWLLLLLLALAPSPVLCVCLHELLTADGIFLKTRGAKGIATGENKAESSLPCSASLLLLTRSHRWSKENWSSLSSPRLGKQNTWFLCAAFTTRKESGCFFKNMINTSLNHRCEWSVYSHCTTSPPAQHCNTAVNS